MSQTRWTPTPWIVHHDNPVKIDGQFWTIVGSGCPNWTDDDTPPFPAVCYIPHRRDTGKLPQNRLAAARLIAKAPEMAEWIHRAGRALQAIALDLVDTDDPACIGDADKYATLAEEARALLAEIEGD